MNLNRVDLITGANWYLSLVMSSQGVQGTWAAKAWTSDCANMFRVEQSRCITNRKVNISTSMVRVRSALLGK